MCVFWLKHLEKLSYKLKRPCIVCVHVYRLSCNYNMFVSPVMVTKKNKRPKDRERERERTRQTKQKHLGSSLVDQKVAGGSQWDQHIWSYLPARVCMFKKNVFLLGITWTLISFLVLFFCFLFFLCINSCLRSDSYYCWNIHCHNMENM